MSFIRKIVVLPAKNNHACYLSFILLNNKNENNITTGIINFTIKTPWYTKEKEEKVINQLICPNTYQNYQNYQDYKEDYINTNLLPQPLSLKYYSPVKLNIDDYETDNIKDFVEKCAFSNSGQDKQFINKLFDIMLSKGSDEVWEELETYYNIMFNV